MRLPPLRWTPLTGLGLGIGLIVAVGLAWTGLGAREAARGRLLMLEAMASAGGAPAQPLLASGLSYEQEDRRAAEVALLASIRAAAAERRLLLEKVALVPLEKDAPAELAADVTVSGAEADVLHFARAIESARPTVRFIRWRIGRTGPAETAIRLDARAFAVWEPR